MSVYCLGENDLCGSSPMRHGSDLPPNLAAKHKLSSELAQARKSSRRERPDTYAEVVRGHVTASQAGF